MVSLATIYEIKKGYKRLEFSCGCHDTLLNCQYPKRQLQRGITKAECFFDGYSKSLFSGVSIINNTIIGKKLLLYFALFSFPSASKRLAENVKNVLHASRIIIVYDWNMMKEPNRPTPQSPLQTKMECPTIKDLKLEGA